MGRQNDTTSPSASARFVKRTARVHRIPPRVDDVAQRPSGGRDRIAIVLICPRRQSKLLKIRNIGILWMGDGHQPHSPSVRHTLLGFAPKCYIIDMTTAEDVEKAVEQLPPRELARFRAWFEAFDAAQFDAAIERDIHAGKLDAHADEALAAHRAGRSRDL